MKQSASEIRSEIAPLIRALREQRQALGIPQDELDHMIGCADGLIAKIESGVRNPSLLLLSWWAEALGLEIMFRETKPRTRRNYRKTARQQQGQLWLV